VSRNVTCFSGLAVTEKRRRTRSRLHQNLFPIENLISFQNLNLALTLFIVSNYKVIELDDGGSHTFKERSEDMGSWQAVRKVLTIEAKGEGEEDLWSRDCEGDCQGVHGVLHYTVHPTEKEFRLKARDGKEI